MNKRFSHIKRRLTDIFKSYRKPKAPATLDDAIMAYFQEGHHCPYELASAMNTDAVNLYFMATSNRARANIRARLTPEDEMTIRDRHHALVYGKK